MLFRSFALLAPSVSDEYQSKGLGNRLLEVMISKLKEMHRKHLILWGGVQADNSKALAFYEKNGFVPFDTHVFILGDDRQTDILMKKPI